MTLGMITYRQLGRNGQLGNQLWQIAGTIGIAYKAGDMAAFPFWRYRSYFSVPALWRRPETATRAVCRVTRRGPLSRRRARADLHAVRAAIG